MSVIIHSSVNPEARERAGMQPDDCWATLSIRSNTSTCYVGLRVTKEGQVEVDAFPNSQAVFPKDESPDVVMAIQEFLESL